MSSREVSPDRTTPESSLPTTPAGKYGQPQKANLRQPWKDWVDMRLTDTNEDYFGDEVPVIPAKECGAITNIG